MSGTGTAGNAAIHGSSALCERMGFAANRETASSSRWAGTSRNRIVATVRCDGCVCDVRTMQGNANRHPRAWIPAIIGRVSTSLPNDQNAATMGVLDGGVGHGAAAGVSCSPSPSGWVSRSSR